MSENPEIAAAAAAGAAAAVNEVQEKEEIEAQVTDAQIVAEIAADNASVAAEAATESVSASVVAQSTAAEAANEAREAQEIASTALAGNSTLEDRITRIETEQEKFFSEARSFFSRLQESENSNTVETVEVDNAKPDQATGTDNSGGKGVSTESGDTGTQPRRHRFGKR